MPESNYFEMSPSEMLQALGDDASKWADAFCQCHGRITYHAMHVWFANAIDHSIAVRRERESGTVTDAMLDAGALAYLNTDGSAKDAIGAAYRAMRLAKPVAEATSPEKPMTLTERAALREIAMWCGRGVSFPYTRRQPTMLKLEARGFVRKSGRKFGEQFGYTITPVGIEARKGMAA